MPTLMRLANKDDAAPVQEIYAPIVRDTATSFETEVPDVIEMRRRISITSGRPALAGVRERRPYLGVCLRRRLLYRAAYQWSVDFPV